MHEPDAALPGSDIAMLLGVVEIFSTNHNAPVVGIGQAGDAIEQRGFSSAGSSKQNRETRERAEMYCQVEGALKIWKAFTNTDFEFRRNRLKRWRRGPRRDDDFYRHGPTAQGRRFSPYTVDKIKNDMSNRTSAVRFAPE